MLVVHGLITLAGAAVLMVFPTAIPSAAGITIERSHYLLVYLIAAAELAVAVLWIGAARLIDWGGIAVGGHDVRGAAHDERHPRHRLHGHDGMDGTLVANTALRFGVAVVFIAASPEAARRHQTAGTKR